MDAEVAVVRRRKRDDSYKRDRRKGSIKSRIIQLSRQPGESHWDNTENILRDDSDLKPQQLSIHAGRYNPSDTYNIEVEVHENPADIGIIEAINIDDPTTKEGGNLPSQHKTEERKSGYDYSFISSCSLPVSVDHSSRSSQSGSFYNSDEFHSADSNVRVRRPRNNATQSGHLLLSVLEQYFKGLEQAHSFVLSDLPDPEPLYRYIREVFEQLDCDHRGAVSRQDFEALCDILQIDKSLPAVTSKRRSGLQWLSSYYPNRPHTPASPILVDKLSEASYHRIGPKPFLQEPTSFLWTLGPRPFWELWPGKRAKKEHLSLPDFTRRLLEQWALSNGYPVDIIQDLPVWNINDMDDFPRKKKVRISETPMTKKKPTAKAIPKISRKHSRYSSNGTRYHKVKGSDRKTATRGKSSLFSLCMKRNSIDSQILDQQSEISVLTDIVEDIRGSLQLSDAQNLALQVMLRRISSGDITQPSPRQTNSKFQYRMNKSEKQLENLVKELKEISITEYPELPTNNAASNGSSDNHGINYGEPQTPVAGLYIKEPVCSNLQQRLGKGMKGILHTEQQGMLVHAQDPDKETDIISNQQEEPKDEQLSFRETPDINMNETYRQLLQSEVTVQKLRATLLKELKSAKHILLSSLNNIEDLENESEKVPDIHSKSLQSKIEKLELLLLHPDDQFSHPMHRGAVDNTSMELKQLSVSTKTPTHSPPTRPTTSDKLMISPTTSSGHYSADYTSPFPPGTETEKKESSSNLVKLKMEIAQLKSRLYESEKNWAEERNCLLTELNQFREVFGHSLVQESSTNPQSASSIEEKIREILIVIRSLHSLNIPHNVLGTMVVTAVESAHDPVAGEVQVFRFLQLLHQATREYEKQAADGLLERAMEAVEDSPRSNTSESGASTEDSVASLPLGMDTMEPRRPSTHLASLNY